MTPADDQQDPVGKMFAQLDELQRNANVNAVFGQPVMVGDKTLIPIASVTFGFGLGFGEGQGQTGDDQEEPGGGSGAGGGAAAMTRPLGVAEITPERTRIEPIVNEQAVALAGVLLVGWSVFWAAWAITRILGHR